MFKKGFSTCLVGNISHCFFWIESLVAKIVWCCVVFMCECTCVHNALLGMK